MREGNRTMTKAAEKKAEDLIDALPATGIVPPAVDPNASREPVVGEWAGIPQYGCPFCAYDALIESAVTAHIREMHPLPAPKITGPDSPDVNGAPSNG